MPGLLGWLTGGSPSSRLETNRLPAPHRVADDRSSNCHPPALEARALVRGFGEGETRTVAVDNVSLKLHKKELALLMGPSGSGKSTLLAVISGLLHPEAGHVVALGDELWAKAAQEMERFRLEHCSYIFQGCNLFPALTARQQLELVLRWGEGASASDARQRAADMLAQLGLSKKGHLRPAALSGGEKQRVAIARALVKQPTFLFADEPTSALDWENGQQVIELLHRAAHEREAMVLVVTHDSRLLPYADRVFHMEDGRLVSEELPKKLAMHGRLHSQPTPAHAHVKPPVHTPVAAGPNFRINLGAFLQDA
jgi:putative ABC transport system ATP-binding protein